MRTKFNGILTLILAFVVQATFAQKTITGTVSDDMGPIPSANVMVKGTTNGTATDFDGKYSISAKTGDVLVFSYAGTQSAEKTVGSSNVINVTLKVTEIEGVELVAAKGIKVKPRETAYSSQALDAKDLGIGKDANLKTALNGKIAGVQVAAQSGAKLGNTGKVYLRGAISATGRDEAIYIVDGIQTSSENVDMDNVASINVLKGPAAVGLYGLRGANGVIVITTKSGKSGKTRVSVFNNTTFENVAYLMNYQNEYGQGYNQNFNVYDQSALAFGFAPMPSEWSVLDGQRYQANSYADESWGPKLDGGQYIPWYAWWPGTADDPNPYYGQTAKYEAQKDNVKDYYKTGVTIKSGFSVSGGTEASRGIVSYSRTAQDGLLPYTNLTNDNIALKFNFDINEKLSIAANAKYNKQFVKGQIDDTYGTGTSGSFNQWFGRNLDINKMKELKNLKNLDGYTATWNWWNPSYYAAGRLLGIGDDSLLKPVFWMNPYFQQELIQTENTTDRVSGAINVDYAIKDNLKLDFKISKNGYDYHSMRRTPYELQYNTAYVGTYAYGASQDSPNINSMSEYNSRLNQIELNSSIRYDANISDDFSFQMILGGESRVSKYNSESLAMKNQRVDPTGGEFGFVIPDLFSFSNSREKIIPKLVDSQYKTKTVYSRIKFGYKNFLTLTTDISNVWDSRYDILGANNKNSFMFGTIGTAFIFTDLMENKGFLDYGKLYASYATIGTEIGAHDINPTYSLDYYRGLTYNVNNSPTMYTPLVAANRNVAPAVSTAIEGGVDLRMLKSKVKLSVTYFNEHRKNEILQTSISSATGFSNMLTNAGDIQRKGLEIELGLKVLNKKDFKWNIDTNWAKINSHVISLAEGQEGQIITRGDSFRAIEFINIPGEDWGQIKGNAIKRDAAGNPIFNASDKYETESKNFGSVLPDFNGGIVNSFTYKDISLAATIAFQKGGKFFSLSEYWGTQTGLLDTTVGNNDLGNPVRDDVLSGGGVHIVGVDLSGTPVDKYVDANAYYSQFNSIHLAEPFVHDASYVKLSSLSLSYSIPKDILGKHIQEAHIGVIARNLGMLAVSKDNKQNWDPSEFRYQWGEDAGLPGTRSIGFNVRLTF